VEGKYIVSFNWEKMQRVVRVLLLNSQGEGWVRQEFLEMVHTMGKKGVLSQVQCS
jgi:hypothetical protein